MRRRTFLLSLPAAAVAGGCGGPATGVVAGTVRHNGKPLAGGTVTFAPKVPTDDAQPVTVAVGPDGRYTTGPLPLGDWLVGVQPPRPVDESASKPENPSLPPPPPPAPPAWAKKYADPLRSGLTVTLTGPAQDFPIELN